ncbi:MAG: bifunctional (p)ppGpp synthetase/guanosine-3',5'-bis(diphosphate) 3'-pyrophosphohydrolase [Rhodospirillaceae bacterium]|nr:bifunctional (p)ppGpp synthetase/guanosine-3',5'-bis(diphosphate) 3'-pyrophosphohydrolase [Rhodospirillaceae bacterium]
MIRQYELVERVKSYDPTADEDALNRAYVFAMKAHGAQRRASGDPYFSHPLEVAGILTGMQLDHHTIITALLHDTVEDTKATVADIELMFGGEIASLVDGVTKLSRIGLVSDNRKQAENFRKLVIAMSDDIRVLLVKLADRLHNMRTLKFIEDGEKRRRIAFETMDIYSPLAERIGSHEIKDELEYLAFKELNTDAFDTVTARLDFLVSRGGDIISQIETELLETCVASGLDVKISGRAKSPYSVWQKMQRKSVAIEQLSDIVAFRLLVPSPMDCYRALGIIHSVYPVLPGRFKDYISTPKPNGYQSLHTGIIGPKRQRVEIQIRTQEMHEVAELGVAAHWSYKQGKEGVREGKQYRWLRELLDILEQASDPEEFLEHTRLEMYQDQVFAFTPKGELIALPRGANPVDFAYAVHSEVGDTCVGAKINGKLRPLTTQLENGDQVFIETSQDASPSPLWEQFVVTGKAKAAIRRFVRNERYEQFCDLGKAILQKTLKKMGVRYSQKLLLQSMETLKFDNVEDVLAAVGEGVVSAQEVVQAALPDKSYTNRQSHNNVVSINKGKKNDSIPLKGLIPGMAFHYAHCCHPLPGERIVGIATTGKGVTIHTTDCETLEGFQSMPERWLDVSWDIDSSSSKQIGRLGVVLENEPGSLGSLTSTIGKNSGNIINLKIVTRSTDFFEMQIDVEVNDIKHLRNIIAALRATPVITSVERARG